MTNQQRGSTERDELVPDQETAQQAALLEQMLHAKTVLEDGRRNLRASYTTQAGKLFHSELWSLGGDMPHLDFDMTHLEGTAELSKLREEISLDALLMTRDLNDAGRLAALMHMEP